MCKEPVAAGITSATQKIFTTENSSYWSERSICVNLGWHAHFHFSEKGCNATEKTLGFAGEAVLWKSKDRFKWCCRHHVSLWQIKAHFKLPLFKTLVAAALRGLFPHEFQSQHQETGNPEQLETILMPVRSRIISRSCWFRASVPLCSSRIKQRSTEEKVAKVQGSWKRSNTTLTHADGKQFGVMFHFAKDKQQLISYSKVIWS